MNPRRHKWAFLVLPLLPIWSTSADLPSNAQTDTLRNQPKSLPAVGITDTSRKIYPKGIRVRMMSPDSNNQTARHLLLTPEDKKRIYTRDLLLRPQDRFRVAPADSTRHQEFKGEIKK